MPAGRLSTHVLNLTTGRPAAGVKIEVFRIDPGTGPEGRAEERQLVGAAETNADGRTAAPLLSDVGMTAGTFEVVFDVGEYFGMRAGERFLEKVPVRFVIHDPEGAYHVPLLVTPWAYQTYRGS